MWYSVSQNFPFVIPLIPWTKIYVIICNYYVSYILICPRHPICPNSDSNKYQTHLTLDIFPIIGRRNSETGSCCMWSLSTQDPTTSASQYSELQMCIIKSNSAYFKLYKLHINGVKKYTIIDWVWWHVPLITTFGRCGTRDRRTGENTTHL